MATGKEANFPYSFIQVTVDLIQNSNFMEFQKIARMKEFFYWIWGLLNLIYIQI